MQKTSHDWKGYLEPKNVVMDLLAGRNAPTVPSMPICENTVWVSFCHQRILEKWAERIDASGGDSIAVEWDDYVAVRAEVCEEIFAHYFAGPSWMAVPVQATRPGLAGSTITRRGDELFHTTRTGREIPMGNFRRSSSEAILRGELGHDLTWDSQIGFASFKDHGGWHPPADRREEFRKGVPYQLAEPDDPDALGQGDIIDIENWIPRYAFSQTDAESKPTADDLLFEEFVAPVVKIALDFYHERGFRVVYYPMGNATPHLEPMKDLDWDALSLEESRRDYVIDIKEVRRVMGPDRVLFGNMAADMIEHGSDDDLIAEARTQITHAAEHGNFILSCGTPIAPGVRADRMRFFCELSHLI